MENSAPEVRAFIAIELPATLKSFLNRISSELKQSGADVKWVKPESMHLTLKFLGTVRRETIPLIDAELRNICSNLPVMDMQVRGLGAFPNSSRPRVIWIGLKDHSGRLDTLASKVDEAMATLGFEQEKRPFKPHLTLGRVRSSTGSRDLAAAVNRQSDLNGPSFTADRVVLFQSILKPAGAEYRVLGSYESAGKPQN